MAKLLLIVSLLVLNFSLASDWKLEKNKNGIKIYTRSVSGSEIKEFKAFTTINADRLEVARVLTRVSDFMNWYPDVTESRVLKRISSTQQIIYYKVDVPWPADDRDVVLDFKVVTNKAKKETKIVMKENLTTKKEVDGVVRMTQAEGFWKLTSEGNKTKVHYQFLADPGGNMATWIINMFIVDSPFDTITALKEKVE